MHIIDEDSNIVRTATGSGTSLQFSWDGNGDGGTNLPDGVYYYSISAQTNGRSFFSAMMSTSVAASSSLSMVDDTPELWAISPDGNILPLAIYPPGTDTNDFLIFEATPSEMRPQPMALAGSAMTFAANDASPSDAGGYNGPSAQNTTAPTRPPTSPVRNAHGNVGVAIFDHMGTNFYAGPRNGLPLPGHSGEVQLEGSYGSSEYDPIPEAGACANDFALTMKKKGWWGDSSFNLSGATLRVNDLRRASLGGNEVFGNVDVGLIIDHGTYGTSPDYHSDAGSYSFQTYLAIDNPSGGGWLRLSELGTGGNLKWMAILACNMLRTENYNSMWNAGVLPIGGNMHVLCGTASVSACGDVGGLWAYRMTRNALLGGAETVRQAWYDAGSQQYHEADMSGSGTIVFRVAYQDNCRDDTLKNYQSSTSGNVEDDTQQVYP